MSAMQKVKDALLKAGFSGENSRECAEGGEKTPRSPHVAMDFVRRALDAAAPWWQSQGAEPKDGERIVNSPVESETRPTALGAGRRMEAMQRKAGSRPPIGELPDTPKGMAGDEAIAEDALVMDADAANAELQQMQSELDKHDQQYHGGNYKGGPCKLRDKVAKAAKNLGMGGKAVKNLVGAKGGAGSGGAAGAGGGGETEAPEVPDEAEKKFKDDVSAIKAEYQKLRDEAKNAPDRKQREKKLAKMYKKKMQKARMEYLTEALQMPPAEAGACEEIAQKVEEGSPEAKKVVEELRQNPNLSETQKAALEVVSESAPEGEGKEGENAEGSEGTPAPETAEGTETAEQAEGGETTATAEGEAAAPAAEPTDEQFEDELKKAFPDKAQMIDKLSQNFDTLNDLLNDEQKKKFWELNEGGDEAAFYTFLGDECGFSAEEVSALRDLTDAYRAANPNDYPEYAEQHKHDELLAKVKKADHRLNNDVKRGKLSGIKNRLEIKGFSKEEIEQYMDAMGLTEDQKFAVMNDLPVPPKVPTAEEMAQRKAEQAAAEKMDAYRKAHDQASKDKKLEDPETAQKLNDLLKEAMEAKKAAKNPASAAPTAAPAQEATAPAEGAETAESGGATESGNAPTAKATKEEAAAQSLDDPVKEGTTPEDHAKVCKANPKSNCPFLKAHMSEEALAALDKPEGAQTAATGETAAPATGTAQPAAEPSASSVPPDSSGGETAATAETAEPSAAPAAETEATAEEPGPLPEPLPEYTPPEGSVLDDEDKAWLEDLREQYKAATDPAERESIKQWYDDATRDLDMTVAALQAQKQIDSDPTAQIFAEKQPGFLDNIKNFFGGMAKAAQDPIMDVDAKWRKRLGLPEKGDIRRSELNSALARAKQAKARADEAEKARKEQEKASRGKSEFQKPLPTVDGIKLADESLLDPPTNQSASLADSQMYANKIKDKLNKASLDVKGIESVNVGPSATSVEMKVGDGFSIAKAKKLIDDLASTGVKVSSIEYEDGKENTIRVDFTNKKMANVGLADVVTSDEWKTARSKPGIPAAFGKDSAGRPVVKNLAKMPHTLVTGMTGSGKSVFLQGVINSSQMAKTPKELRQVCIDGKGQEFGSQEGSPYNLYPVAKDAKDVARIMSSLRHEMEDRAKKLGVDLDGYDETKNVYHGDASRSLDDFNAKQKNEDDKLPYIATYIDELATYSKDPEYGKQIMDDLDQLLAKARSVGMNFMLSTQRNDVGSVPGRLLGNIPGRVIFKASPDDTKADDEAKSLKGAGDMIIKDKDGSKTRGRGVFMSDRELEAIPKHYRAQNPDSESTASTQPRKVGNFKGMDVIKAPDGKLTYEYQGNQYKPVRRRYKDGSVKEGWMRSDGSDPRFYYFPQRPTT